MGAEVIKIEEPTGGDETRKWTPFVNGESTQFLTFNRNKRSLSVNLKEAEGLKIVQDLAADADVMIESFRAGTLDQQVVTRHVGHRSGAAVSGDGAIDNARVGLLDGLVA